VNEWERRIISTQGRQHILVSKEAAFAIIAVRGLDRGTGDRA
jgi:hypothetical protein